MTSHFPHTKHLFTLNSGFTLQYRSTATCAQARMPGWENAEDEFHRLLTACVCVCVLCVTTHQVCKLVHAVWRNKRTWFPLVSSGFLIGGFSSISLNLTKFKFRTTRIFYTYAYSIARRRRARRPLPFIGWLLSN